MARRILSLLNVATYRLWLAMSATAIDGGLSWRETGPAGRTPGTEFSGGTLLEVALLEHHCRKYMKQAKQLGFSAVEISDGTITMPDFRRKNIIHCALESGLVAITEVVKKTRASNPVPSKLPSRLCSILNMVQAGW